MGRTNRTRWKRRATAVTIEKGEPWGSPFEGELPTISAADDADLARLAHDGRAGGGQPLILIGPGDVAATVGIDHPLPGGGPAAARYHGFPLDLGYVELGRRPGQPERTVPFAAHVLGRRRFPGGRWPEVIVMNTPLAAGLRLGPRAHPNDGRLDVTVGALPWRQAREARRRAGSGGHLPHPRLEVRRCTATEFRPGYPVRVEVDGVDQGRWAWLSVSIIPDAYIGLARVA